jgi:hypothetical protein
MTTYRMIAVIAFCSVIAVTAWPQDVIVAVPPNVGPGRELPPQLRLLAVPLNYG